MIPNDYLDGHPAWKAREAAREAELDKMREFLAAAAKETYLPYAHAWQDWLVGRAAEYLDRAVKL